MYLNILKATNDKPTTNFMLNDEVLKVFPLSSKTRQRCPLLSFLFNIVLEFIARAIKKKILKIQLRKKAVKLSTFADYMVYREDTC